METQAIHSKSQPIQNVKSSQDAQQTSQPKSIKLCNSSEKRIVFRVKTAKKNATTTPTGVLDPKETAILMIKTDGKEENDRLTIEWTHPPNDVNDKQYRTEYFCEESLIKRKNIVGRFPTICAVLATFES